MAQQAKRVGRISTARMKPSQSNREQVIATMIMSGGMTNDQVWSAFEAQDQSIIRLDDPRRVAGLVDVPFNSEERQRLGRAIRSVRGLAQKAAGDTQDLLDVLGDKETRPANQVALENIKRFDCGDPVMNDIYGKTNYVWLIPSDLQGKKNPKTGKIWDYGDEIPKSLLPYLDPMTGFPSVEKIESKLPSHVRFGDKTGYVEMGIPVSFVSTWGGEPGVGKSRLAIALEKSCCMMHEGRAVMHNFGESNLAQLRQWIGPKAPDNLIVGERKTMAQLLADIYKYKPILVIQDSLQTLVDAGTTKGMKDVLATMKQLATEESAGKPHIINVSQLNKKGELKGSNDLSHIVDFVAKVQKRETRKGVFYFTSVKNRGGPCPAQADYMHTEDGVVCLGAGSKNRPKINLQVGTNPVIAQGVMNPADLPDDGGENIG